MSQNKESKESKQCSRCKLTKPVSEFAAHRRHKDGRQAWCRVCDAIRLRAYRAGIKAAAFDAYGGPVCAECGKEGAENLCIDYPGRSPAPGADTIYQWLKRHDYPDNMGFRVLCRNCRFLHTKAPAQRKKGTERYRELRREALEVYGGRCVNCGEDDARVLCIDYTGDAAVPTSGRAKYRWLQDNGFPQEFRLLCRNCIGKRDK